MDQTVFNKVKMPILADKGADNQQDDTQTCYFRFLVIHF